MKKMGVLACEAIITALIVMAVCLSSKKILFISNPRSAVITLGIIGIAAFCTVSVGKFINAAPAHSLTVAGYIVGTVAMLIFLTQVFKWNMPVISDAKTALLILAVCIIVKSIIARVGYVFLNLK